MKSCFLYAIFLILSIKSFSQFGVSYHSSSIPFVGFSYQVSDKFLPELRIGTNNYFENTGVEVTLNYIFKQSTDVQTYAGLGARANLLEGILVPIGLNAYPFTGKNFGFHAEFAPIFVVNGEEDVILRGSWGIRYRFLD